MAGESFTFVADMGDPLQKQKAVAAIGALRAGRWRIEAVRYRPRRSDRQNAYYWPCFVEPWRDYLRECKGDESIDSEEAHRDLCNTLLSQEIIDRRTGEVRVIPRRSSTLSTVEFNDYLDRVAAYLLEQCGHAVPPPNVYHWRDETPAAADADEW